MAVDAMSKVANSLFNDSLITQAGATANNSTMEMDDFWKLLAAQLQYQDMSNPMSNSEMMNQMTQMASMSAMSKVSETIERLSTVTNDMSQVTLTTYSTGLLGKKVKVAETDASGVVTGLKEGTVTGVDLTGSQGVYVDGKKYELSQVMGVGEVPGKNGSNTEGTTGTSGV